MRDSGFGFQDSGFRFRVSGFRFQDSWFGYREGHELLDEGNARQQRVAVPAASGKDKTVTPATFSLSHVSHPPRALDVQGGAPGGCSTLRNTGGGGSGGGAHLEDEQGGERRPEHVQQLSQLPAPRIQLCTRENEAWKP